MDEQNMILGEYKEIATLTQRMLAAARQSEWDTLIELERDCGEHFSRVIESSHVQPDDDDYRSRKAALIRGILDADAEIRLLVEPWLAQLSVLIGNTQQQSRLQHAYHAGD